MRETKRMENIAEAEDKIAYAKYILERTPKKRFKKTEGTVKFMGYYAQQNSKGITKVSMFETPDGKDVLKIFGGVHPVNLIFENKAEQKKFLRILFKAWGYKIYKASGNRGEYVYIKKK